MFFSPRAQEGEPVLNEGVGITDHIAPQRRHLSSVFCSQIPARIHHSPDSIQAAGLRLLLWILAPYPPMSLVYVLTSLSTAL
jgi:hypothetical protein